MKVHMTVKIVLLVLREHVLIDRAEVVVLAWSSTFEHLMKHDAA
jgi:hypothetical protein